MARGNSTRRNLAPEDISKLIRGDKEALDKQAATGGNKPKAEAPKTEEQKGKEEGKKEGENPWWDKENNGILKRMLFGRGRSGMINEAVGEVGGTEELQQLIAKKRGQLGLKPGQPLPLPPTAVVPPGVSISG